MDNIKETVDAFISATCKAGLLASMDSVKTSKAKKSVSITFSKEGAAQQLASFVEDLTLSRLFKEMMLSIGDEYAFRIEDKKSSPEAARLIRIYKVD